MALSRKARAAVRCILDLSDEDLERLDRDEDSFIQQDDVLDQLQDTDTIPEIPPDFPEKGR